MSKANKKTATVKTTKATKAAALKAEMQAAEQDLISRYPDANIVPGSLRGAGAREGHGTKRTVVCRCRCGAKRVLATSDLFSTRGRCAACVAEDQKAARRKQAS
jgi:hypothetical protein